MYIILLNTITIKLKPNHLTSGHTRLSRVQLVGLKSRICRLTSPKFSA